MPKRAKVHRPSRPAAKQHRPPGSDRQQRRALNTGSQEWRRQRARVLVRDSYICAHCGGYGDHADHISGNAHEMVDDDQLQTLCLRCHASKTAREQDGRRRHC